MHKVLYRSLLRVARETDADPALKQELMRRSHPLLQLASTGFNSNLLDAKVIFDQDLFGNEEMPISYREIVALDSKAEVDQENQDVVALHPDYGVDVMSCVCYWDASILAKLKDGSVSLIFKDNDKCTWNAANVKNSVFPRLTLPSYLLYHQNRVAVNGKPNPNNDDNDDNADLLNDGNNNNLDDSISVQVLAVGGYYGAERLPKWFRGTCTAPTATSAARPNFFSSLESKHHIDVHDGGGDGDLNGLGAGVDEHKVMGGGVSFTWLCRALFRQQVKSTLTAALTSAGVSSSSSSLPLEGKDREENDQSSDMDRIFEVFGEVSKAQQTIYGTTSYAKNIATQPFWLKHIKATKQLSSPPTGPQTPPSNRLWSRWGSKLVCPNIDSLKKSSTTSPRELDWLVFETVSALQASNAAYFKAYEKCDLEMMGKIWGFSDQLEENGDDQKLRSFNKSPLAVEDGSEMLGRDQYINARLHSNVMESPTLVHPSGNGVARIAKGFENIKLFYDVNFEMRSNTNLEVLIENSEVKMDPSYLSGIVTNVVRVEIPSHSPDAHSNSFTVRMFIVSNSFKRKEIGQPFQLVHHHSSMTN